MRWDPEIKEHKKSEMRTDASGQTITKVVSVSQTYLKEKVGTDVLLETLIIFLLIFLKAHLLFGYPAIWLPSLFLELCLCVKQAADLTCKPAHGD